MAGSDAAGTDSVQQCRPHSNTRLLALLQLMGLVGDVTIAVIKTIIIIIKSAYRHVFPAEGKSLSGEVVLVTGAGHGLGRQLALQFAHHGCVVVCVDVDTGSNEETVRDINMTYTRRGRPAEAHAYTCDVSSQEQVLHMAEDVLMRVGRVDILVNNAGVMPAEAFVGVAAQHVLDVININVLSHFWTLLAFLPGMVSRRHGHVVAVSSMAGLCGLANMVCYSASKHAVAGLMEALAEELRALHTQTDIHLTCVHPYFLHTRTDLPQDLHLRITELSPEFAATEIIDAVRHNIRMVTVPRNMLFWINILRSLPQDARDVWRDVFHTCVIPPMVGQAPAQQVLAKT